MPTQHSTKHNPQKTPPPVSTKDPNLMTNEERLAEITELLTRAVVRYCHSHERAHLSKKSQSPLTKGVGTSVHRGSND